jgi:hypothetical protein
MTGLSCTIQSQSESLHHLLACEHLLQSDAESSPKHLFHLEDYNSNQHLKLLWRLDFFFLGQGGRRTSGFERYLLVVD